MWNQSAGLPWSELKVTATRQRLTKESGSVTTDARGEQILDWSKAETQTFRCQVQPHQGQTETKSEGLTSKSTHILFCNPQASPSDKTPIDIKFGDRITVIVTGNKYRVDWVEDAGGEGDHLEVLLSALEPGGDG